MRKTLLARVWWLGAMVTLMTSVTACGETAPSRFFTLSSLPPPAASHAALTDPLLVGLGPVSLPAYLDRAQIVTRENSFQIALSEFERWAEPLQDTVERVLVENLSTLLQTNDVIRMPSRRITPLDYQVEVSVLQFDGDETGRVVLDTWWELFGTDGRTSIARYRSTMIEQAETALPADTAAAMSRALAELSVKMAEAIRAAPR